MSKTITDLIADAYPRIATDLLGEQLRLLQISRAYCGNDLDKFLILIVVGLRSADHPEFKARTPDELVGTYLDVFPGYGTNVRSVSESLGLPRETTRRKIQDLVDTGWLAWGEGRRLHFTVKAYRELAPVREALEQTAAAYFSVVDGLRRTAVSCRLTPS